MTNFLPPTLGFARGGVVAGSGNSTWTVSTTASPGYIIPLSTFAAAGGNGPLNTASFTNSAVWKGLTIPEKVRKGKYRVRCRGCARWAKILSETKLGGFPRWRVHCERCFGENEGFAA